MPTLASVLIFSRDPQLLHTRTLILQRAGCITFAASSLKDVHRLLSQSHMDVVLLCHTLSTEECNETLRLSHATWRGVQVVAMLAGASGCDSTVDATVNSSRGPVELIKTIQKHTVMPRMQESPANSGRAPEIKY